MYSLSNMAILGKYLCEISGGYKKCILKWSPVTCLFLESLGHFWLPSSQTSPKTHFWLMISPWFQHPTLQAAILCKRHQPAKTTHRQLDNFAICLFVWLCLGSFLAEIALQETDPFAICEWWAVLLVANGSNLGSSKVPTSIISDAPEIRAKPTKRIQKETLFQWDEHFTTHFFKGPPQNSEKKTRKKNIISAWKLHFGVVEGFEQKSRES